MTEEFIQNGKHCHVLAAFKLAVWSSEAYSCLSSRVTPTVGIYLSTMWIRPWHPNTPTTLESLFLPHLHTQIDRDIDWESFLEEETLQLTLKDSEKLAKEREMEF